ncbi:YcxB family protein [Streptomyces gibsoniae]|uniref:YcxB family protein n=1 Tax=Streptomyces gibsoniae TaxID=3075529 RepID=A0ABU2U764_9ACTN|nr:YcxB family protein [Streptomyces sp. DSM 41699]MDT0469072.1 YcxB family protein [Streptomyces sp. DSM 41699]
MMNIDLSYVLQPDELIHARLRMARRRRIIVWAFAIVFLVLGLALTLGRGDHGPDSTGFLCIGVGVMYVLVLTLGTRMAVKKQAPRLCKPTQALLTVDRFTIETDLERGEFKWAAITKIRETNEVFLLHPSARLFIVIPKRAFAPEQLTEFSAFVADRGAGTPNGAPAVQERVAQ